MGAAGHGLSRWAGREPSHERVHVSRVSPLQATPSWVRGLSVGATQHVPESLPHVRRCLSVDPPLPVWIRDPQTSWAHLWHLAGLWLPKVRVTMSGRLVVRPPRQGKCLSGVGQPSPGPRLCPQSSASPLPPGQAENRIAALEERPDGAAALHYIRKMLLFLRKGAGGIKGCT